MIDESNFKIEKIMDGTFRITRTDMPDDHHSHFQSKQLAKKVIHNVCTGKIPLDTSDYALESMHRLSNDENIVIRLSNYWIQENQKARNSILILIRKCFEDYFYLILGKNTRHFRCGMDSLNRFRHEPNTIVNSFNGMIGSKVLMKQISLICFRVYLEVYVVKNQTRFSRWSVRNIIVSVLCQNIIGTIS